MEWRLGPVKETFYFFLLFQFGVFFRDFAAQGGFLRLPFFIKRMLNFGVLGGICGCY